MRKRQQLLLATVPVCGLVFYYFWRKRVGKQWFRQISIGKPDLSSIKVLETAEETEKAAAEILHCLKSVPFCGLDCEWVGKNPTALLQLSVFDQEAASAKCFLFRLSRLPKSSRIPVLEAVLNNPDFIKLGVGINGDFSRLVNEGFVNPGSEAFLDLRFIAPHSTNCEPGGLSSLVRQKLGRKLDKDWRIRASDWEGELSDRQIIYAADDSLSALQLLAVFVNELSLSTVSAIIADYTNCIFKPRKQNKPKLSKEEQLKNKIEKRVENRVHVDDHIKSYSTHKAPLYNK
jgi:ribonuclease D